MHHPNLARKWAHKYGSKVNTNNGTPVGKSDRSDNQTSRAIKRAATKRLKGNKK